MKEGHWGGGKRKDISGVDSVVYLFSMPLHSPTATAPQEALALFKCARVLLLLIFVFFLSESISSFFIMGLLASLFCFSLPSLCSISHFTPLPSLSLLFIYFFSDKLLKKAVQPPSTTLPPSFSMVGSQSHKKSKREQHLSLSLSLSHTRSLFFSNPLSSFFSGIGCAKDPAGAARLFSELAAAGHAISQVCL